MPLKRGIIIRDGKIMNGRKPGSKNAVTLVRDRVFNKVEQAMLKDVMNIAEAQLDIAKGINVLMVQNDKGGWTRVTNDENVEKIMNDPQKKWKIVTQAPDNTAITNIMDRLFGRPIERKVLQGNVSISLDLLDS